MSESPVKTRHTLGCCGLDCGLCPRYYTAGPSRCPGCCGPRFFEKHPSCGYITCCVRKRKLEVCALCEEFPCSRFEPWLDERGERDSFITYRNVKSNMNLIRSRGMDAFMEQQAKRMKLLQTMIAEFDDGRSRSFYCIAAALLPIADIEAALERARNGIDADDRTTRAKTLRQLLGDAAASRGIELKLRK
jgi:hypothetical protein